MAKQFSVRALPNNSDLEDLGYPDILQRLFYQRGVTNKYDVQTGLSQLISAEGLAGCMDACELLYDALLTQKKILVIGDYDVDGATATAVLIKALRLYGFMYADFLIPNRFENGYGLSKEIVEHASKLSSAPDIIITVDNGITSIEGVEYAKSLGMKVIVTDHHLPGAVLPNADVIINPQCCRDTFVSHSLAGVGVAFYLCIALRAHLQKVKYFTANNVSMPNLASLLDLVALGTIADLVPLDKNNRVLAYQGLMRMRQGRCSHGLRALLSLSKISFSTVSSDDIAFRVAPKLNAAGRMDDMTIGVRCLLADDQQKAYSLAAMLVDFNTQRRQIQHDMFDLALMQLKQCADQNKGVCLFHDTWHQGIIGILASRVKELCYKPVIILAPGEDGVIKGSARSIAGVNIREILACVAKERPDVLYKFGGHAMAAGLSIKSSDRELFTTLFVKACEVIDNDVFIEQIETDGALSSEELSLQTAKIIFEYGVWGVGFPTPLFENSFVLISKRLIKTQHVQLELSMHGKKYQAMWFFASEEYLSLQDNAHYTLCYQLSVNTYLGVDKLSIIVRDARSERQLVN